MEKDMAAEGFRLTRGTMSVWIMTFTDQCFLPVWQYMADLLKQQDHQQADETFGRVINDGRSAGSTSYYWLHTSSEFYTGNKIICFCFRRIGPDHDPDLRGQGRIQISQPDTERYTPPAACQAR